MGVKNEVNLFLVDIILIMPVVLSSLHNNRRKRVLQLAIATLELEFSQKRRNRSAKNFCCLRRRGISLTLARTP